jgi:hypothetical protein
VLSYGGRSLCQYEIFVIGPYLLFYFMLITGNIFEGATFVQDETIKKVYLLCAHGTYLKFQYGKQQASNIFFPRWPCTKSFANSDFFSETRTKII